jgi:hypothetical protein
MEKFRTIADKARTTAASTKNTRAKSAPTASLASPTASPTMPSVERVSRVSSSSSKSIDKRLDDIECALKKLELNLILVDGDGEDFDEYSNLKNNLKEKCKADTELSDFLSSMDNKRNSNRLKKLINWLSLICPLITLFNQTSLSQIISAKFTNKDLGIADTTFQKYAITAGGIFTEFLDGIEKHKDNIDILDKVYEVEIVPPIANTVFANITRVPGTIMTQLPSIIRRVHVLSKPMLIDVISKGKHYSSKLCKSYNILITTFYLSMFMYILFYSKFRFKPDNTHHNITDMFKNMNTTTFLKNSGGKKSKKTKKSKKR